MKKEYFDCELEIIFLTDTDIIVTSACDFGAEMCRDENGGYFD